MAGLAGMILMSTGVVMNAHGWRGRRGRERLETKLAEEAALESA